LARAAFRLLALPVALVVLMTTFGVGYEAWAEHDERGRFPAPGQLVDIGNGELIHVRTWGAQNSGPALILLAGAGIPSSAWAWIAADLSDQYRITAVDPPSIGWSTGGSGPRDAQATADAVVAALTRAGIDPPYVMVAHSYAGFAARVLIGQHRAGVAAAVMLDTSVPGTPGSGYGFFFRMNALRGHLGLLYLAPPSNDYASLPAGEAQAANAVSRWTSHLDGAADELETWNVSADEARAAGTFGSLPMLIIARQGSEQDLVWQQEVVQLSTDSRFVVMNVGHTQMLTEPDQAAQVSAQIRSFLGGVLQADLSGR
jgi:pimeloyl-ACP methyl ester carboxylesterase